MQAATTPILPSVRRIILSRSSRCSSVGLCGWLAPGPIENEEFSSLALPQNGRFLKPFAKLLLAVAALRDHDTLMARELLTELQQEFPRNSLYSHELSRLMAQESIPQGANEE